MASVGVQLLHSRWPFVSWNGRWKIKKSLPCVPSSLKSFGSFPHFCCSSHTLIRLVEQPIRVTSQQICSISWRILQMVQNAPQKLVAQVLPDGPTYWNKQGGYSFLWFYNFVIFRSCLTWKRSFRGMMETMNRNFINFIKQCRYMHMNYHPLWPRNFFG